MKNYTTSRHLVNGFLTTEIPLNDTKKVEITEMGSIDFEGNYKGASSNKWDTFQNYDDNFLTITLQDYENNVSLSEQNVI